MQSIESENQRLKDELQQLKSTQARNELIAEVSAAVSADITLSGLINRESRPHPATIAKKVKKVRLSKKGHLKGVAPGQLLTQPHIIQGIKEHEQKERESAQKKETERAALLELRKLARAAAAAEKKKKKAEDAATARQAKRPRSAPSPAEKEDEEAETASDSDEAAE